jgi:hypothetical protein
MRGTGKSGRTIKLSPVDEAQVTDHPARAGLEALMDQKLFHQRIRSERASAYWFAASLWGGTGLARGAIMGVFRTMMVPNGSVPLIRDTLVQGTAIRAAQDTVNNRDPLLPGENEQPQSEPQQP